MSKKVKFLEDKMIFDSDSTTKSILANRVDEIKLGYEQEKVEPEKILPNTNFLGIPDKFKAYVNEVGGSEYIGSPSFSAGKEEISAFYLGGTFIANTCEKMLTQDPRTVLEIPESVEDVLKNLNLSIMVDDLKMKCIVPLENIEGWGDTDVSTWEKPIDPASIGQEEVKVIEGEWIVLNGGAVYKGDMQSNLVIKFVPEDLEDFQEIIIDLKPEIKTTTLLNGLYAFFCLDGNGKDACGGESLTWTGDFVSFSSGKVGQAIGAEIGGAESTGGVYRIEDGKILTAYTLAYWHRFQSLDWEQGMPIKTTGKDKQPGLSGKIDNYSYGSGHTYYVNTAINPRVEGKILDNAGTNWHHYVESYNAETGEFCLYVDGLLVKKATGIIPESNLTLTSITIHGNTNQPAMESWWGKGWEDEVGIWDRVLTDDEILELYQKGVEGKSYPF